MRTHHTLSFGPVNFRNRTTQSFSLTLQNAERPSYFECNPDGYVSFCSAPFWFTDSIVSRTFTVVPPGVSPEGHFGEKVGEIECRGRVFTIFFK